jgi:hypothetical protein
VSDLDAGLFGEDPASAEAPGPTQADIDKVKAELSAEFEKRLTGFQRLVSKKDEALEAAMREIEELKTAGLSEDEREQLQVTKMREENQRLQAQNELLRLGGEYGDVMPYFERLLAGSSAKEQLEVMREFASLKAQAQGEPDPDPDPEIPDIDLNRPMRQPVQGVVLPDGTVMNDELADRILGSVPIQAQVTQRSRR